MLHPAIIRQRARNKTIWIAREYHNTLQIRARKMGCSITYLVNQILKKYLEKGEKKENE
jgi:hypothetical protein